jgi:site-specific DNA-methyltransferase (adenine-specific)
MKPYYESERGKFYLGDCLEIMPQLQDRFDLCFTDPPYGIGEAAGKSKSRGNFTKKKTEKNPKGTPIKSIDYGNSPWDNKIPDKAVFDLIFSLSDNQIIFGGNYFVEYLKNSPCWIVWDKDNTGDFADAELIYTSFKTAVRIFKFRWNGMLQQDMKHKEKRYHPTQKPVKLCENILSQYSEAAQSILDPFAGVGSLVVAAEGLGHPWVACEREEAYCEIAAKRIEEAATQMRF